MRALVDQLSQNVPHDRSEILFSDRNGDVANLLSQTILGTDRRNWPTHLYSSRWLSETGCGITTPICEMTEWRRPFYILNLVSLRQ